MVSVMNNELAYVDKLVDVFDIDLIASDAAYEIHQAQLLDSVI